MVIRPANYQHIDWIGALASKPKDQPSDLALRAESDVGSNVLDDTASIAFGLAPKAENKSDAIVRASREISENAAQQKTAAMVKSIKDKIAVAGIDPVALGVGFRMPDGQFQKVSKEQWDSANDPTLVEKIATTAAAEYEKQLKQAWQKDAVKPQQALVSTFDATLSRVGKIMSAAGRNEDVAATPGIVPANSAGILQPNRIDELAKAENLHDKSVAGIKASQKAREADKKAQLAELAKVAAEQPDAMKMGQVIPAGGEDASVFSHRTPSNQVSMKDTMGTGKLSSEEIKASLSKLFTRVEDNGQAIREANKTHKEAIRGEEKKDRSWEQVNKPLSTSDLSKRLADALWPKPAGQ